MSRLLHLRVRGYEGGERERTRQQRLKRSLSVLVKLLLASLATGLGGKLFFTYLTVICNIFIGSTTL